MRCASTRQGHPLPDVPMASRVKPVTDLNATKDEPVRWHGGHPASINLQLLFGHVESEASRQHAQRGLHHRQGDRLA